MLEPLEFEGLAMALGSLQEQLYEAQSQTKEALNRASLAFIFAIFAIAAVVGMATVVYDGQPETVEQPVVRCSYWEA